MDTTSRAMIVRTRSGDVVPTTTAKNGNKNSHGTTFGTMVKKFMEKRSNLKPGSSDRKTAALPLPANLVAVAAAEEVKNKKKKHEEGKASNLTALHRKLFQKAGGGSPAGKALTEVKANTRTLAMVLRSERELLNQRKVYDDEIQELRLLLVEKDREVRVYICRVLKFVEFVF